MKPPDAPPDARIGADGKARALPQVDWSKPTAIMEAAARAVPWVQAVALAPKDPEVCARAWGAIALLENLLAREVKKAKRRKR